MKKVIVVFAIFSATFSFAQKDSLALGEHYADDQLYFLMSYNQLFNQPNTVKASGFSYSLSTGFIKDIILNNSGSFSLGLGVGYSYDFFNHGLKVSRSNGQTSFEIDNALISNKLLSHNIEFPLEFRWRNSTAQKYSFWRIYAGLKASYNFANTFRFDDGTNISTFKNIPEFTNWQLGLTLSVGYDAFTAQMYYGLNSIFSDAKISGTNEDINTKILKVGLIIYLL